MIRNFFPSSVFQNLTIETGKQKTITRIRTSYRVNGEVLIVPEKSSMQLNKSIV